MAENLFSSPRWYLRFFQFIERLPIPGWLLASLVIIISAVAHHLVAWQGGYLDPGQFHPSLAYHGVYYVLLPFAWIFLAKRATRDLEIFFSDSGKGEEEIHGIIADFNSLPEIASLSIVVIGSINGFINYRYLGIPAIHLSGLVLPGANAFVWIFGATFGFMLLARMIRQTSIMHRYYDEIEVDLFGPTRIYALSRYGAITSASILVIFYILIFSSFPQFISLRAGILYQLLIFILLILFYFIPLTGINRRMRRAKAELLKGANEDLRDLYDQIHAAAAVQNNVALDNFQGPLATLRESREMIKAIPTWPWQPNSLRNLFVPLLFPITVFLLQLFIEGVIGR